MWLVATVYIILTVILHCYSYYRVITGGVLNCDSDIGRLYLPYYLPCWWCYSVTCTLLHTPGTYITPVVPSRHRLPFTLRDTCHVVDTCRWLLLLTKAYYTVEVYCWNYCWYLLWKWPIHWYIILIIIDDYNWYYRGIIYLIVYLLK